MSLISPDDSLALCAVLLTLTWLGFLVDRSRFSKTIPGVLVILLSGVVLSNLHITPFSSSVSDFVTRYVVAAAIPLLMIKADLRKIFIESGRVMIGFATACVGIICGVLVGYAALRPWHVSSNVAGFYTGAFIGGTISMIAVGNAVKMTASEISVATGASMIPSMLGLMALVALPSFKFVRRHLPAPKARGSSNPGSHAIDVNAAPEFRLTHVTGALALSFCICVAARVVAGAVGKLLGHDQSQYWILYVTALTVVIANAAPRPLQRLRGEFELGMILMYMFLGMIGLGTNITSFLGSAISLFVYVIILLAIGIAVSMMLSKLLRLDLAEAITGCGAAIVGPAATAAVVAGKGWYEMVSPAVLVGIFCHVVGNFVGIAVATALR